MFLYMSTLFSLNITQKKNRTFMETIGVGDRKSFRLLVLTQKQHDPFPIRVMNYCHIFSRLQLIGARRSVNEIITHFLLQPPSYVRKSEFDWTVVFFGMAATVICRSEKINRA